MDDFPAEVVEIILKHVLADVESSSAALRLVCQRWNHIVVFRLFPHLLNAIEQQADRLTDMPFACPSPFGPPSILPKLYPFIPKNPWTKTSARYMSQGQRNLHCMKCSRSCFNIPCALDFVYESQVKPRDDGDADADWDEEDMLPSVPDLTMPPVWTLKDIFCWQCFLEPGFVKYWMQQKSMTRLQMYALNFNVIRVMSGMGGLQYSN